MGERRMNEGRTISFTLGGLAFEYDEQRIKSTLKSMEFPSKVRRASFLIMTESNYATMSIVKAKYDMIP